MDAGDGFHGLATATSIVPDIISTRSHCHA